MLTIPKVAAALQAVLTTVAEQAARTSGAVQRTVKFTGAHLVQTLVFGWLAEPQAARTQLCTMAARRGVDVRPQSLAERFTAALADCLQAVVEAALTTVVTADAAVAPLLARFAGVYVFDSTTIALPDALAAVWPGCGGRVPQGSAAARKVQAGVDLCSGRLLGSLHAGRAQDQRAPHLTMPLPVGAVRLQDLGFFNLDRLAAWDGAGIFFLCRLGAGTVVLTADGQAWEAGRLLAAQAQAVVDRPVAVGQRTRLRCRLIAVRVPAVVAAERRRKRRAAAGRAGQVPSAARRALADWTVLITNIPAGQLTVAEALVLARVRWQIELLLGRWKDGGQVDAWRSTQPWRILWEVYAKLIGQVVQHWVLLTGGGAAPERSWAKAAAVVRAEAPGLATALASRRRLLRWLHALARLLRPLSAVTPRRTRPATFQLLADPALQPLPDPALLAAVA